MLGAIVGGTVRLTAGGTEVDRTGERADAGFDERVVGAGPAVGCWLQAVAVSVPTTRSVVRPSGRHEADSVDIVAVFQVGAAWRGTQLETLAIRTGTTPNGSSAYVRETRW